MKSIALLFITFSFFATPLAQNTNKGEVHILYTPGHPANSFIPAKNIGAALDGHSNGDIDKMLTRDNITVMKSVGLKPVSYRLRTELAGEVWHWNPKGTWSDKTKKQGYWISDAVSNVPIEISNGYRLPRRGNTFDQANNDGYSRISDGDTATFWKSNPYLDTYYTKESNQLHPQWVIVDLGNFQKVNAMQIKWGTPYALSFKIDYASDVDPDYFDPYQSDIWHSFSTNFSNVSTDSNTVIKITGKQLKIRYLRVSMTESSYTSPSESSDVRDKLGFAIKEMSVGFLNKNRKFYDWMRHSPDHEQSIIYVSSTDCWHRAQDIDPDVEQAGIDRLFAHGLTGGQPALLPAALLYDSPDNVLAMLKYSRANHYAVEELEMGEEPEGQLISPVDYAALYYQWGSKIRAVEPGIRMGGPGFATLSPTEEEDSTFTESKWTTLFLNYLKSHNSIDLFNFFTFEWYPFDDLCASTAPQLAEAPDKLSIALKNIQNVLPENTPLYVTEYGYSAYEGKPEVEIEGALMYADILGQFMQLGGSKSFLYSYEPAYLQQTNHCGYGNNMLFGLGSDGKIKYKTAAYFGMKMLTQYWAQPSDSLLELYPAACNIHNRKKQSLISTYPLWRVDGTWSVMLINKDPVKTWEVAVDVENTFTKQKTALHPANLIQYSKQQYHWLNKGINSYPSICLPPVIKKINYFDNISLPPYSLTIIETGTN
ncbi:MAG: discoidin domain-containing protein [Ginsengibacter sp.]